MQIKTKTNYYRTPVRMDYVKKEKKKKRNKEQPLFGWDVVKSNPH